MEDNLSKLDSVELQLLLKLADMPEFRVLQKFHDIMLREMQTTAFERVDLTPELQIAHAKQIGHKMAWDRDRDLKKIVNKFIELKTRVEEAKKKKVDNK